MLILVSYVNVMVVRYFPQQWQKLLGRDTGDFAFPLIRASINLVIERFPELALQAMQRDLERFS